MSMFGNMPGGDSNPIQSVMNQLRGGIRKGSRAGRKNKDYLIRLENQAKMYGYQSDLRKSEIGTKGEQDRLTIGTKGSQDRRTIGKKGKEERLTIGEKGNQSRLNTSHGTDEAIRFHGATGAGAPNRMKTENYDVGFNAPKATKKQTQTQPIVNSNTGSAGQVIPSRVTPQTPGATQVPTTPSTKSKKTGTKSKGKSSNGAAGTSPAVDLSGF